MKITNRLGLPKALVDAVRADTYNSGDSWRTVTQLISPPRAVLLKKIHYDEIEEDVADRLYAMYGQIAHGILERANTIAKVEERLFMEVLGKKISGAFDTLLLENGLLSDYKLSTYYKAKEPSDEWISQMNLLAVLFRHHGIEIKEAEIVLLMRDHSKRKAKVDPTYPQLPVARIPTPLWNKEVQDKYLLSRVQAHLDAEKELPQCSSNDRWEKESVFAVMKKGKKSAVRLYNEESFALEHVKLDPDNLSIVKRLGESIRCEDYCSAAPFCDQFKKIKKLTAE